MNHKAVFTTGQAAVICKLSQQTIIRCFDNGQLEGFRVPGSKFRRIPRDALLEFMKEHNIPLDGLEGDKIRVLVVDDDPEIVELFVDALCHCLQIKRRPFQVEFHQIGQTSRYLSKRVRQQG